MDNKLTSSLLFLLHFIIFTRTETYNVNIKTDRHINVVDSKFLSFTIDPKVLFSSGEKYKRKECLCMASSLAPAFIRVAGPSTSHLTFRNSTIYIDDQPPQNLFSNEPDDSRAGVSRRQWSLLLRRAARARLQPVVALSTRARTAGGLWDPNSALDALSAAHRQRAQDMYWQLGYECSNHTIEEYLNDLETLRVIIATFPPGKSGQWKVVGGDITNCLQVYSKSDFKDYVTFSNDMMDAIFLNGNSSFREVERMPERDRSDLYKMLSLSTTPLWFTGHSRFSSLSPASPLRSMERAMEWLTSLGVAAADGYSVHFWELEEDEIWQPTLSFYMALLFKNLVGRRVLSVHGSEQVPLFSSCASRGSLVLYGANPSWRSAHLAVEGVSSAAGDVLQYVLRLDDHGNIVVNGHAMLHDGNIKPMVKRVRAYKTLILNLPPKSFGFWVLASTQVEACNVNRTSNDKFHYDIEANDAEDNNLIKTKRSTHSSNEDFTSEESVDESEESIMWEKNKEIKETVDNINNDLRKYNQKNTNNFGNNNANRVKRKTFENENTSRPKKNRISQNFKSRRSADKQLLRNILVTKVPKLSKDNMGRIKKNIFLKLRDVKRNLKLRPIRKIAAEKQNKVRKSHNDIPKSNTKTILNNIKDITKTDATDNKIRNRRNVNKNTKYEEYSIENEILENSKETFKIGKIINKLKKLSKLPIEIQNTGDKDNEDYKENVSNEGILIKTKLSDDSAAIDITEKSNSGLFRSTIQDIISLLADFNKNMKTFLTAITIFE